MVTKTIDQVGYIVSILDKVETGYRSLMNHQTELQAELDEIERLGYCDAKPYYRDEKYFYLIYPMKNGERKREYIGSDPEKIQDALDKIERKSRHDEIEKQINEIVFARNRISDYLLGAHRLAYSIKW